MRFQYHNKLLKLKLLQFKNSQLIKYHENYQQTNSHNSYADLHSTF